MKSYKIQNDWKYKFLFQDKNLSGHRTSYTMVVLQDTSKFKLHIQVYMFKLHT